MRTQIFRSKHTLSIRRSLPGGPVWLTLATKCRNRVSHLCRALRLATTQAFIAGWELSSISASPRTNQPVYGYRRLETGKYRSPGWSCPKLSRTSRKHIWAWIDQTTQTSTQIRLELTVKWYRRPSRVLNMRDHQSLLVRCAWYLAGLPLWYTSFLSTDRRNTTALYTSRAI